MQPSAFFIDSFPRPGEPAAWIALMAMGLAVLLGVLLFRERPRHDPGVHSPRMAWLRAAIYFCFVVVFSWTTGVLGVVTGGPAWQPGQSENPAWWAGVAACLAVIAWGYVYFWPRGTITHGRPSVPLVALPYGLCWGIASGLMSLSLYALLEVFGWPWLVNALLLLGLVAVYNLNYQLGWWDIHVSPPHNLRAWNNRKVLLAHNPFLIVTVAFFLLYGNAALYVAFNALAMGASAVAMRFPPFWAPDGPAVSVQTAIGE